MQMVDEPGGEEVTDDGGTATDPDVLALDRVTGGVQGLGGRGVEEVERRAALHLDRGTRAMGENEGQRMERRGGGPPSLVVGVVLPSRRTELPRPHDLGADAGKELLGKGVVGAAASAVLAEHRVPVPGGEHPLVQPMAGMAER